MNSATEGQLIFLQAFLEKQRLKVGIKATPQEYQVAVLTLNDLAFPANPAPGVCA